MLFLSYSVVPSCYKSSSYNLSSILHTHTEIRQCMKCLSKRGLKQWNIIKPSASNSGCSLTVLVWLYYKTNSTFNNLTVICVYVLQMMRNLLLEEGGLLQVESASLPVASYAKFQPQSVDFLDITNPKAVYPLKGKSFPLFLLAEVKEYWNLSCQKCFPFI